MSDGGGKDQITRLVRFKIDNHRRPILKTGFLPVPPVLSVTLSATLISVGAYLTGSKHNSTTNSDMLD